jgi:uridine kinase
VQEARTPAEVAILLRPSGSSRIAIEGTDGSGKTSLANELASELGVAVFHLDDFVAKNQGAYTANLDAAKLANSIG